MKDSSSFLELCARRRSVRRFSDRPVEREKIIYCLEAARLAPSAENRQPVRWLIFDEPAVRQAVCKLVFSGIYRPSLRFAAAPVLAALLIRDDLALNRLAALLLGTPLQFVDAGIAGEHFVLAAAEQGLGTCWIGWFNARALSRHFGLAKSRLLPVCLIAVGYPAADSPPPGERPHRRPLAELTNWNPFPRGKK